MVNDSCKDSFKRFTNEPALVCSPSPENADDEKEKQEVKNLAEPTAKRQTRITPCLKNFRVICKESIFHSSKTPQVSLVFAITSTLPSIEPKDSLIMGDEHLSTFSTEEIVPIPRESEETSRSGSKNVLPSCEVPRNNFVTFSNPLFEFDVNFNSSDINHLFDEELEDIECKDSYDSNLDESTFLLTPLSDSNKEESLIPRDDIEFLLNDPLHHEFTMIPPGIIREHEYYINRMSLLCSNSSSQSPENFYTIIESLPIFTTRIEDSDPNREEIDIFSGPDDSIPPGIESDFDLEEDIIDNLLNNDPTHEHLNFNIEPDAPVINNVDELNEDECFDPRGGEIDVEVDNSFTFVT
ncbi:hypothetical protein Tco_0913413 [Tanacetum coccineum]